MPSLQHQHAVLVVHRAGHGHHARGALGLELAAVCKFGGPLIGDVQGLDGLFCPPGVVGDHRHGSFKIYDFDDAMALALLRLADLTGRKDLHACAVGTLALFEPEIKAQPMSAPP